MTAKLYKRVGLGQYGRNQQFLAQSTATRKTRAGIGQATLEEVCGTLVTRPILEYGRQQSYCLHA